MLHLTKAYGEFLDRAIAELKAGQIGPAAALPPKVAGQAAAIPDRNPIMEPPCAGTAPAPLNINDGSS